MHKNTILLFLCLFGSSYNYNYSLRRYGSSADCASSVNHIALELVDGTCGLWDCTPIGQEYYTIYSCNATETSFNESLFQYGLGRNFSIGWFYSDSACTNLYAIEARVVGTCEGAENYECQSSHTSKMKCLYIQPDPPHESIPIATPQSILVPDIPLDQPQSPTVPRSPNVPTSSPQSPSAPLSIPIPTNQTQSSPTAQIPAAELAGNKSPVSNSSTSDVETIIIVSLVVLLVALLLAGAKKVHDAKKLKNNSSNPEESQNLLSVEIEAEEDDIRGRGSYSIVKEVIKDGKKYALKKILTDTSDLYDEYKIMHQLDHRNILKVHKFSVTTDEMPGLQSDFCDCSLADRITTLTDREVLSYIKQLAIALHYIQFKLPGTKAVIHGDINPRNILFLKEHNVAKYKDLMLLKLADFGLAKMVSKDAILPSFSPRDDEEMYKSKVMDIWTASDILHRNTYSFVTDLHSFAVVCAQIMLKNISDDLEDLNDKLIETKTKSTTYHAQIASFCVDVIDYKNQKAISDPSAKIDKRKLISKRPESAIEVKSRLEEFKRMIALQEKMLLAASAQKENKGVVEHD